MPETERQECAYLACQPSLHLLHHSVAQGMQAQHGRVEQLSVLQLQWDGPASGGDKRRQPQRRRSRCTPHLEWPLDACLDLWHPSTSWPAAQRLPQWEVQAASVMGLTGALTHVDSWQHGN